MQQVPSSSPNHVSSLKKEQSSVNAAASSCSNGLGELKTSSPNILGEQGSSAPNGPDDQGSGAVGMESAEEVGTDKTTEPHAKQTLLQSPTMVPNNNSPPQFPARGEQNLIPEKNSSPSPAPTEDLQPQQPKDPASGSCLSETGLQPSQQNTSNATKPGQAAAVSTANGLNPSNSYDFFYQTSLLLGEEAVFWASLAHLLL